MAADLVSRKVAVILLLVGGNLDGVRAAIAATPTIPIVLQLLAIPSLPGWSQVLTARVAMPRGDGIRR
jgi:hypothetical protein